MQSRESLNSLCDTLYSAANDSIYDLNRIAGVISSKELLSVGFRGVLNQYCEIRYTSTQSLSYNVIINQNRNTITLVLVATSAYILL